MKTVLPRGYVPQAPAVRGGVGLEQFGQIKTFAAPWRENERRLVLMASLPEAKVNSVYLGCSNPLSTLTVEGYKLNWVLTLGAGGAQTVVRFDALPGQQINVPAARYTIELECVAQLSGNFAGPENPIEAVAFLGEYPVDSSPAQLTNYWTGPLASTIRIPVPPAASGWRVGGPRPSATTSPFVAAVIFELRTPRIAPMDTFQGDELLPLRTAPGFLPIPGGCYEMRIQQGSVNDKFGSVVWSLDL